jgi:hypothetical protein
VEAVKQAERLAAKYDPSGKMFNVGEVVVLADGSVKSKERLRKIEELKIQRERDRKAAEEAKQVTQAIKQATKEARRRGADPPTTIEGINPERLAQIQSAPAHHISNTQKKKKDLYAPKPVTPKPVIPEGIAIPEGEENMIALWDITDEDIQKRLNEVKRKKGQERAAFKKQQKKEKIFRRAMKAKKKQAHNRGEDFDPEKAAKEILEGQKESKSTTDSDSDSNSDSSSDSDSDADSEAEVKEVKDRQPEVRADTPNAKSDDGKKSKSKKRSNSEVSNGEHVATAEPAEEPKHKKSKKDKKPSSHDIDNDYISLEAGTDEPPAEKVTEKKSKSIYKFKSKSKADLEPPPEAVKKIVQKEKVRLKKDKKRQEKLAKALEVADNIESQSKKRKRSKDQDEVEPAKNGKPEKPHKKKKAEHVEQEATSNLHTASAEQWNPDALTGDKARKEKFLRLLGAGKSTGASSKNKSNTGTTDISKVQNDLEKQYEAGMKLKHDGGSKRRGLGA